MKTGHLIFNVIAISIALFLALAEIFNLDAEATHRHFFHRWPGLWDFCLIYNIILVLLIGGGSLANFMNRRLTVGPTVGMIVGFMLTVVLLPLAVWGAVYVRSEIKKTAKINAQFARNAALHQPGHTPAQNRKMFLRELHFFWERWF